jgi:hypothetical protein
VTSLNKIQTTCGRCVDIAATELSLRKSICKIRPKWRGAMENANFPNAASYFEYSSGLGVHFLRHFCLKNKCYYRCHTARSHKTLLHIVRVNITCIDLSFYSTSISQGVMSAYPATQTDGTASDSTALMICGSGLMQDAGETRQTEQRQQLSVHQQ